MKSILGSGPGLLLQWRLEFLLPEILAGWISRGLCVGKGTEGKKKTRECNITIERLVTHPENLTTDFEIIMRVGYVLGCDMQIAVGQIDQIVDESRRRGEQRADYTR